MQKRGIGMHEKATGEELFDELARIRKYISRKMNRLEELIESFGYPGEPGFWEARQALLLTQRYFTDITINAYNKIVAELNLEYKNHK